MKRKTTRASTRSSAEWNAARIKKVLEYYERQSDEEGAREIETAKAAASVTLVEVPADLLPEVRKLIAKHRKSA